MPATRKQEAKVAKRSKQNDDDDDNGNGDEKQIAQPKAEPQEAERPRLTWKGEQPVKRWGTIDFPKDQPVSLAQLAPHTVEGMARDCQGNDNWLFEPK
jgi:hypothetical protein